MVFIATEKVIKSTIGVMLGVDKIIANADDDNASNTFILFSDAHGNQVKINFANGMDGLSDTLLVIKQAIADENERIMAE